MQLKELEEHELITKKIYPVVPSKVEYSLTEFGETLIPVLTALGQWGDEHQERLRHLILKQLGQLPIDKILYATVQVFGNQEIIPKMG